MKRKDILRHLTALVQSHGESAGRGERRIEVFDLCSDYGFDLDGSTIDRIETEGRDHLKFYFNENTGDFDYETAFDTDSLTDFFYRLRSALALYESNGRGRVVFVLPRTHGFQKSIRSLDRDDCEQFLRELIHDDSYQGAACLFTVKEFESWYNDADGISSDEYFIKFFG